MTTRLFLVLTILFVIVCVPSQTFSPMYSLAKGKIQPTKFNAYIQNTLLTPIVSGSIIMNDRYVHTAPTMIDDIYSDDSQTKYISYSIGFDDPLYHPADLIYISHPSIHTQGKPKIRSIASDALYALADAFQRVHHARLAIVSAHRTAKQQDRIYRLCSKGFCAPAGHSEHQAGLAIDLFVTSTSEEFLAKKNFARYYARFLANAHLYGRHNTYRKGIHIDTYNKEPRHWRYIGIPLATLLHDEDITLAEWAQKREQKK